MQAKEIGSTAQRAFNIYIACVAWPSLQPCKNQLLQALHESDREWRMEFYELGMRGNILLK